jgi:glycosyltransferase involved in cell wall biosynthesis
VRENRGISTTRNELWKAATADFVAFLDSDDLYAPNRLERMLQAAPRVGPYFGFSGVEFLCELGAGRRVSLPDAYDLLLGQSMAFPTAGFALLRFNISVSTSNFVISRDLFDMVGGFDDRIKICQDWDFAVQTLRFVEPTFIPEPLLAYRIHARNTSGVPSKSAERERDLVVEKMCDWIAAPTPNPRADAPKLAAVLRHLRPPQPVRRRSTAGVAVAAGAPNAGGRCRCRRAGDPGDSRACCGGAVPGIDPAAHSGGSDDAL